MRLKKREISMKKGKKNWLDQLLKCLSLLEKKSFAY